MGTRISNMARAKLTRPSHLATISKNLPCPSESVISQSRDNMTVIDAVLLWDLYDDWAYELHIENYEQRSRRLSNACDVLAKWLSNEYGITPIDCLIPNRTPEPINNPFKKIFGENHD
jgi:hypothetical protein